jgi:hypothetical protein
MIDCANCTDPATYAYRVSADQRILFCSNHLPAFLRTEKYQPLLEGTEFFEEKKKAALQKLSAPKPEVAKPAPKKGRTTKKSTQVKAPKKDVVDTLDVQASTANEVTE